MDDQIKAELDKPLDPKRIHSIPEKFGSFLEGWDVIDHLNSILGYDGWSYDIVNLTVRETGFTYAQIRLTLNDTGSAALLGVSREDVGVGIPAGDSAEAMETAIKGAVTDGLKRCARTLGNQFGNPLYDQNQTNVARPAGPPPHLVPTQPVSSDPGPTDADYGDPDTFTPVQAGKATERAPVAPERDFSSAGGVFTDADGIRYSPAQCPEHGPWRSSRSDRGGMWVRCDARGGSKPNARGYCGHAPTAEIGKLTEGELAKSDMPFE